MKVSVFVLLVVLVYVESAKKRGPPCNKDDMKTLWPDPNDKAMFYRCIATGSSMSVPCPTGQNFSFKRQRCTDGQGKRKPTFSSKGHKKENKLPSPKTTTLMPPTPKMPPGYGGNETLYEKVSPPTKKPQEPPTFKTTTFDGVPTPFGAANSIYPTPRTTNV